MIDYGRNRFVIDAEKAGWNCKLSTIEEDIKDHWDVEISKDDISLKVDVKALKKINRKKDNDVNENIIWLEILNKRNNIGWTYGKADGAFFELKESWIYVSLKDLQKVIKEKLKMDENDIPKLMDDPFQYNLVYEPEKGFYTLYKRLYGFDITTYVLTRDIIPYIKHLILK